MVDGRRITSYGGVEVELQVRAAAKTSKSIEVSQKFCVADIAAEPLLEMDFFHNQECVMAFKNYYLRS